MDKNIKIGIYLAILTFVIFGILYLVTALLNPLNALHTTPIWFQIILWILLYFGMIAGMIRLGIV